MTKKPIELQISDETKALMGRLKAHAGTLSLRNSFIVIGMSYRKEVGGIFARTQTRDASLRWDPLEQSTIDAKRRAGYGAMPILQRTERLKKSMTQMGHADNITKISHDSAIFGSEVPYGVYHDNIDAPRTTQKLRNFSQPSVSTYGSWESTIASDIKSQLRMAGVDAA